MKKNCLLVSIVFLSLAQALAQTDSLEFADARWSKQKIKQGI